MTDALSELLQTQAAFIEQWAADLHRVQQDMLRYLQTLKNAQANQETRPPDRAN